MTPERRFDIIDAALQVPLLGAAAMLHTGHIKLLNVSSRAHAFNVALLRKAMN